MSLNENYLGLDQPGVGTVLIIMASQGVFYFIVLFIVESGSGSRARQLMMRFCRRGPHGSAVSPNDLRPRPSQVGFPDEDADVESEREHIIATPPETLFKTDAIVVYGLTKSFSGFRAVNNLTFRVPRVSYTISFFSIARLHAKRLSGRLCGG